MIRAAILAGGQSARFGSDKALADCAGESFLGRAVSLSRRLHLEVVIVAPTARGYGGLFSCAVLEDEQPGQGPLGGLSTLWNKYPAATFLVLTCDMPVLTDEAAMDLLLTHDVRCGATIYEFRGRLEPFPGVYESSLAPAARRALKEGRRSMRGFLETVTTKKIVRWTGTDQGLANVNTPAERVVCLRS